ncbi:hypothetical protein [Rubellimicrobium aerolatum]|uniref:Secreted protein n=1 Tax=Rubellimicrobium aerolatum TaxID=490979 RepID=A0ABW0SBY3_9RHOB|nr:hypothetical protein [Rubellimicrobium aerolatum]MBP1805965.1 hypothetical protein [Rubellimicrobium aerolatum]
MISRLTVVAIPALLLLAACEEGGVLGTGTNTGIGATDAQTAGTTPEGILSSQISAPSNAGTCENLALRIENSETNEVERQASIEERERLGC